MSAGSTVPAAGRRIHRNRLRNSREKFLELFRLNFRIISGTDTRAGNPFRGPGSDLVIVSLDTPVGERTFDALRETDLPPYDLVVFDEAHKLSAAVESHRIRKTQRYELAEALAGCADPTGRFAGLGWAARHLLLLTATPHMGRDSPYHFLWRLLDPQVFGTGEAFRRFPRPARERHFIRRTKEEMVGLDGSTGSIATSGVTSSTPTVPTKTPGRTAPASATRTTRTPCSGRWSRLPSRS